MTSFTSTIAVIRIHNEYKSLCILEIVTPKRSNLILTTYIPHSKTDVLVLNSLDVETNRWDCRYNLSQLELIKNGCLSRSIESDHQDPHLLLGKESSKEL